MVKDNIPYKVFGSYYFYKRKEIKDLLAYLKLIANHNDDVSLRRIINEPRRGIGEKTIASLEKMAQINNTSMFDVIDSGKELEFKNILRDLDKFGVHFDVFSSELEIRKDGAVEKEIEYLRPHIYNDGDALVLRTTDFVDDKDRVIVKSNGDYTYFMPDIVYNLNKASRGFDELICVLGADHHGYINRMKSALMMHGYSKDYYQVELIQMVRFMKNGEEFKASKRSGDSITLKDIYEEVGVDAMRYFFAMRAASGHLDFDMDLAIEQSSSNPVYYAQYAHARLCSILEQGKDIQYDDSHTWLGAESGSSQRPLFVQRRSAYRL